MKKVAYLAIDVHASNCVLGHMDLDGTFFGNRRFPTSERHITESLKAIKAKEKYLALEESNLASVFCPLHLESCILDLSSSILTPDS